MPDINAAYNWAVRTCDLPNVGYSWTYRNQQTVNNITYYDCSSFIWYALIAGGFDCVAANGGSTWPFVTWTMEAVLQRLGFVEVSRTGEIRPGDIGFYDYYNPDTHEHNGHTEMYYQGGNGTGVSMGAHTSSVSLPNQVSINTYPSAGTRWQHIYRYGGGASGQSVKLSVIAAICGNWWGESNVNPAIWESLTPTSWDHQYAYDNIGGYGLGQWTNVGTPHGRCWNLHEWVTNNGYTDGDGDGQIAFLIHEAYWTPATYEQSAYNSLEEFLSSSSDDVATLTKEFMYHWEGINNGTLGTRQARAAQIYQYIQEHLNDPTITGWISGNRYLSESEALNNCVMVARILSIGFAPVGKRPTWLYYKWHYYRKKNLMDKLWNAKREIILRGIDKL